MGRQTLAHNLYNVHGARLNVKLWMCANILHTEFGFLELRKWVTILHPAGVCNIQNSGNMIKQVNINIEVLLSNHNIRTKNPLPLITISSLKDTLVCVAQQN